MHDLHNTLRLTHLSTGSGLSQSTVNCILQDHRGFQWFGTQNGLNRWDGHTFVSYKHSADDKSSVAGTSIIDLYEDGDQNLWVGTARGLNRFDALTETFERFTVQNEGEISISSNIINGICQDEDSPGLLWLGTGHGLGLFATRTRELVSFSIGEANYKESNNIKALCDDGQGSLWLGSDTGLYRFCKAKRVFHKAEVPFATMKVTSLFRSSTTELVVGTEKQGIYSYHTNRCSLEPYGSQALFSAVEKSVISSIGRDLKLKMWFGTADKGVRVYCTESQSVLALEHDRFDSESLPSNWVRAIAFDEKDRVWIGTLTGGVSIHDPHKYKFAHIRSLPSKPASLLSNVVRCFQEDGMGTLWVGTEGGVGRYNHQTREFVHYVHNSEDDQTINSNMVRGMYMDSGCRLWVFTWNGICHFDAEHNKFVRYALPLKTGISISPTDLRFYYEDRDKKAWIGSEKGLVYYDPVSGSVELYNTDPLNPLRIMGDRIRFIFEDSLGTIRISTMSGHSSIKGTNRRSINNYTSDSNNAAPLSTYFTLCFYEDQEFFWFGTMGGLFREDRITGCYKKYGVEQGLPDGTIYGLLPDEQGRLWLSTNRGLSCFTPNMETFRNFDVSDGLQSEEYNNSAYYKTRSGEMFFGGVNGFNRFYPDDVRDDTRPVPLRFSCFHVSNEKLPCTYATEKAGTLHIPYSARQFGFEFVALEYSHPKKIQYAYMLEGFDMDWVHIGNARSVSYRHVPAGEYVFRVKSTNRDGVWCDNEISIAVRVEQPQWLQTLSSGAVTHEQSSELARYLEEMRSHNMELQAKNEALLSHNQKLFSSVYHDALTGLYNRAGYNHYLELYSREAYQPLGLIIIDVDGLKMINDNLGHEAGDKLIQLAAGLIDATAKAKSTEHIVSRIGGDEFAILVANCNESMIREMCDELMFQQGKYNEENPHVYLSVSFGYALSTNVPAKMLFTNADDGMYSYKRAHGEEARRRVLEYIERQQ